MKPRQVALFIVLDLAFLLAVLLVLVYYGMSHLAIATIGLVLLIITLIDMRSGMLSEKFSQLIGFEHPDEKSKFRWLPVVLASLLLIFSLPVLLEHGWVNYDQRWAMRHGQFLRLALPALLGGLAVMAAAVFTIFRGLKK
ncbi:MAG TPA: hypothetical protein ENN91_01515 [Firmicutes bacterium]|nr:hypothetical protein [Bacillota bacterium]